MSNWKFNTEIARLSSTSEWTQLIREWQFNGMFINNDYQTCLCGHYPIKEVCVIENKVTKHTAEVGNVCVGLLPGVVGLYDTSKIFKAVQRAIDDPTKSVGPTGFVYAQEKGWIDDWEISFCLDTWRKRKLSPKQREIRDRINGKIIGEFSRT